MRRQASGVDVYAAGSAGRRGWGAAAVVVGDPRESVVCHAGSVLLGEFRCAADDPDFAHAGRIHNFVIGFPRSAVWIHREHEEPFIADPGLATVYEPGQEYERRAVSLEGDRTDWIGLAPALAEEMLAAIAPGRRVRRPPPVRSAVSSTLYLAQRALFAASREPGADLARVEEHALEIAAVVLSRADGGAPPAAAGVRTRDLVAEARELLLRTLFENLSVTAIAARLEVSPFHLCRVFKRETGQTIHGYRRELRLRAALGLAGAYRGRLSALAYRTGFSSHAHFTAAFRRAFGTHPSATPAAVSTAPPARPRSRDGRT